MKRFLGPKWNVKKCAEVEGVEYNPHFVIGTRDLSHYQILCI